MCKMARISTSINMFLFICTYIHACMGARTVQWKTFDSCTFISESDLKQYTQVEFHGKNP